MFEVTIRFRMRLFLMGWTNHEFRSTHDFCGYSVDKTRRSRLTQFTTLLMTTQSTQCRDVIHVIESYYFNNEYSRDVAMRSSSQLSLITTRYPWTIPEVISITRRISARNITLCSACCYLITTQIYAWRRDAI